ncbi:MAG: hypothetical protein J6R86_03060, partial [Lentisphaeria bacterium]|nr:hypothetical protein [Lentisphaeria bacterium]
FMLPITNKIYPFAYFGYETKAGTVFTLSAYRQYFDPASSSAAVSYGHYESDGYWFYAYFDKAAEETLQLPPELAGKAFEITETCGNIKFPVSGRLTPEGKMNITAGAHSSFTLHIRS